MPSPQQPHDAGGTPERPSLVARILPLAPLIVFVMIAAGYAVLLRPRFSELRDLDARRGITQEVTDLEQRVFELGRTRMTFEQQLAVNREMIDAAVPGGEDAPGLFTALDAAAQRSGVSIGTMEVTREPAPESLHVLGSSPVILVSAALHGVDYARLKSFLDVLAASRRLLDVLSVQFSPQSLSATLRIRAYSLD